MEVALHAIKLGFLLKSPLFINFTTNSFIVNTPLMKAPLTYRILLHEEPEGGFTAMVPSLPGCITYGDNLDQAIAMAKEAIEGYIELLREQNEPVPDDSKTLEYSLTLAS